MEKSEVVIIGCGFTGLSVLRKLSKQKKRVNITVIEKSKNFCFLPLLPDIISRGFYPELLDVDVKYLCSKYQAKLINESAIKIDSKKKTVFTESMHFKYDFLVISLGTQTAYYGMKDFKHNVYKVENSEDALRIRRAVLDKEVENIYISGGGYTGIEIATQVKRLLIKNKIIKNVFIVEKKENILSNLEPWMAKYSEKQINRMNIKIRTDLSVDKVKHGEITFSNGEKSEKSVCIWCAGVIVPDIVKDLCKDLTNQNRIKVSESLLVDDCVFSGGDSACFEADGKCLRMGIQFSISQGKLIAKNIIRMIKNKKLLSFKAIDPGFIVPIANYRSCGKILGIKSKGVFTTLSHYFMCIYRSYGIKRKFKIFFKIISDILGK